MKFNITNSELGILNGYKNPDLPKYTSRLINCANQNAQGTRPNVVGQLSELFKEYINNCKTASIDDWHRWCLEKYPQAIECAVDKIDTQIKNLREAINLIDKNMIHKWVEDLIISKTYNGLFVQKAILSKLATIRGETYRLATPQEEAKGIDGYVGNIAYSIKPSTYKETMSHLQETINAKMIYYDKEKNCLNVEVKD